tara:strand:- start:53 stop:913 length:861 start_codon:yes stop_codon:yes gene_type:complete
MRAAELAKQVLGTNRNVRNQQIMGRDIPGRAQNLAKTVLKTPSPRPGGLVAAGQALARSDAVGRGALAAIGVGGALVLSQTDPSDLGKQMAQIDQPFYELMGQVQESASDLAKIPQVYFMQVKQAYDDERKKQQELQNMQQYGAMEEPELESGEIKPVSLLFAEGGPAISNMDRSIATNEPRFEDRPPELQIFTLNSSIDNLMKTYEMMVRNQDFQGAQQIADQIDQIEQQKIQIQNQPDPSGMDAINRMMQYKGMPVYPEELPFDTLPTDNTSDEISKILQSIAK